MEALASELDSEVTAIALVREELVLAAAAGHTDIAVAPTRVGQRLPFTPPIGSCFAAWGDDNVRGRWTQAVAAELDPDQLATLRAVPDMVRDRGYAIALGHQVGVNLETVSTRINDGDPQVSAGTLREALFQALEGYNSASDIDDEVELRSLTAPVFAADGRIAFTLTLWGRPGLTSAAVVRAHIAAIRATAAAATRAIGGNER